MSAEDRGRIRRTQEDWNMAQARSSGAKKSKGKTDSTKVSREVPGTKPRAHRDDTPEAKMQREGTPKTHPTSNAVASRKSPAGKAGKAAKGDNVQQASGAARGVRGR